MKLKNIFIAGMLLLMFGCAYFNTFFNAQQSYRLAEEKQKAGKSTEIPADARKEYEKAISKSWKLIDIYGDSSSYADDALLMIGKAHYNLAEYPKAERILEQFLLKFLRSELIPETKLWLAKSYIALEKDEKAEELLNKLFESKVSKKIAAQSFYILGDLYYKQENYQKAIENLEKCLDLPSDDETEASAHYLIGESFFNLGTYENAIFSYDKVKKLDIPAIKEYDALIQKVNALSKMEKYSDAEAELRDMLRNPRFTNQYALIETKLANIYEQQGEIRTAQDYYYDIMKKYARAEGVGLAAFYLAQLYELDYGKFDSAKVYYEKATKSKLEKDINDDAASRTVLINEYLKIRDQLRKDRQDIHRLQKGDSTLVDSLEIEPDSSQIKEQVEIDKQIDTENPAFQIQHDARNIALSQSAGDSIQFNTEDSLLANQDRRQNKNKPVKTSKMAINRTPKEVHDSYIKNSFARGEFFMLKYQGYDSAAYAYQEFILNFNDSLLTPKAYYALYYLNNDIFIDSLKADSLKRFILDAFPETTYGKKLSGQEIDSSANEIQVIVDEFKNDYLKAEEYLEQKNYTRAISVLTAIAEKDSGSVWAKKARFAIAYIYEKYLEDLSKAIENYTLLAKEYPNTEFSKIASNKIAPPPQEKPEIIPNRDSIELLEDEGIKADSSFVEPDAVIEGQKEDDPIRYKRGISEPDSLNAEIQE